MIANIHFFTSIFIIFIFLQSFRLDIASEKHAISILVTMLLSGSHICLSIPVPVKQLEPPHVILEIP